MIAPFKESDDFMGRLRPGQLLEALFDNVPEVYFFVKDQNSRFMGASRSFARIMGANEVRDIIGKTDFDFSADFLAEAFIADDRKVMSTGEAICRKRELVPLGESLDWLSTTKIPLFDREGTVVGLAGICHIISDSDEVYLNHPEMRKIIDHVRGNFRNKITAADMAAAAGISVSSVERRFRGTFGVTPLMYLRKTRLNAACRMLRKSRASLVMIARECGFHNQTGMTRAFRQELKITPMRYRRRFSAGAPLYSRQAVPGQPGARARKSTPWAKALPDTNDVVSEV